MGISDTTTTSCTQSPISRLLFVDNLRISLSTLVVLHHIAIIYGAISPFYYVEPPTNDLVAYTVLLVSALFNQAYFMGFFFLIQGTLSPDLMIIRVRSLTLKVGCSVLAFLCSYSYLCYVPFRRSVLTRCPPAYPALPSRLRGYNIRSLSVWDLSGLLRCCLYSTFATSFGG